jgi:hypothetical protein
MAAGEATARMAHEEAASHWERALRVLDAVPEAATPRRADLLLELGEARRRAGDLAGAREGYLRAAELARRGPDADRLGRAALGLHAVGSRSWPSHADQLVAVLEEARAALGDQDAPLRARVLAGLARELAWTGLDLGRAAALAEAAVASARRAGDAATLASCLLAWHNAVWGPGTAAKRLQLTEEVAALAEGTGDRELRVEARLLRVADLLELADPAVHGALAGFLRDAEALRQPRFRYAAQVRRAMQALMGGRFGEVEKLVREAAALGRQVGEPDARDVELSQLAELRGVQGRRTELLDELAELLPDDSPIARWHLATSLLEKGDRDEAGTVASSLGMDPTVAPRDRSWLVGVAYGAELAAALGERPACERLHDALAPYARDAVVVGAAITFNGTVAHYLGLLDAALGRVDEARAHFEQALAAHERLGARPWTLRTRYQLAGLELGGPGPREGARSDLAAVAAAAGRLGMDELARQAGRRAAAGVPPARGTLYRDGAWWVLGFDGTTVRMPDAKGLRDLAALLAAPGQSVHAAELVALSGGGEAGLASLRLGADLLLDERARDQLRARLADLEEEIDEAERWADPERAARARDERDALLDELAAATGLGGRRRRLGDQSERARKAVTARIRDVINRVEQVHPALAAHLRSSVATGTFCSYSPPAPTVWELHRPA